MKVVDLVLKLFLLYFDNSWPLDSHAVYLVAYARGLIVMEYALLMMGHDDVIAMGHDDVFT